MTTTDFFTSLDLETLRFRGQLQEDLVRAPDLTMTADQAAFYVGLHPKKLERLRAENRPPFPLRIDADSKSGSQVYYRVGELHDFIRQSQLKPEQPDTSGMTSTKVINGKRVKPNNMAWVCSDAMEAEALEEPFFVAPNGTTLSHCWDEDVSLVAERLRASTPIQWMTWDKALAGVWQDERLRLSWLSHADTVAPGLRPAVEALRKQALTQM